MTCAKRRVECFITLKSGDQFYGSNDCDNPQPGCPRKHHEGYAKCKDICQQESHAEIAALSQAHQAGVNVRGAEALVMGHYNVCKDCSKALRDAGIKRIVIEVTP